MAYNHRTVYPTMQEGAKDIAVSKGIVTKTSGVVGSGGNTTSGMIKAGPHQENGSHGIAPAVKDR